jgi:hypothetical protein
LNSRRIGPSHVLAALPPAERARHFLTELANLQDNKAAFESFLLRFPWVLDAVGKNIYASYRKAYPPGSPEHIELDRKNWLIPLRNRLRAIWRAPDVATKQWALYGISHDFFLRRNALPDEDLALHWEPPGPPTRTERFLLALISWADLLTYCNNPDCQTPYFIAKRRGQDYCSKPCARVAQRESKRRWWRDKGRQRRVASRRK